MKWNIRNSLSSLVFSKNSGHSKKRRTTCSVIQLFNPKKSISAQDRARWLCKAQEVQEANRAQVVAAESELRCPKIAQLLWQRKIRRRRWTLDLLCLKLGLLPDWHTLAPPACPAQHAQRARACQQAHASHDNDDDQRCACDCRLLLAHDVQGRSRLQTCKAALLLSVPCQRIPSMRL